MRRYLSFWPFVACLALASEASAQTPQEIVDQFFPVDALPVEELTDRRSCFVVQATDESGPTTLIAAYTNSTIGRVRALKRTASGFVVAAESAPNLTLIGQNCDVSLADIDGDAVPDVVVALARAGGDETWLFRWTGTELQSLTPTRIDDGDALTELVNATVLDLYHDGTHQAFSSRAPGGLDTDQASPSLLFTSGPNGLTLDRELLVAAAFVQASPPSPDWWTFLRVTGRTGPYTLRVVNGDATGQQRVSAASIKLNDVELLAPGQLDAGVEFLDLPLTATLLEVNRLDVSMTGPPGSRLTVAIGFTSVP